MGKGAKSGFTIIEVTLVLAIVGMIIAGVIASTQGTLSRRRYQDAVQDISNQFQNIYAQALNTQFASNGITGESCNAEISGSAGRSHCVVYGVLAWGYNDSEKATRIQTAKIVGVDYDYALANESTYRIEAENAKDNILPQIPLNKYINKNLYLP